ncbi:MAG: transketolase family protein [Bryobacteraceae bacterium]|nr:transketolase family protein [Bryobacteraceae bacterium]
MNTLHDCRKAFSKALIELAEADPRIVAVVNDSVGSSNLKDFKQRFPDRLINVGIAEQNMVGIGAGLANGGLVPFVCGASCFLTGRALEQVKVDLGYSRSNVKLCGMSSGVAYGELGPTHHSIEDLAWTRAIANMTVVVPADPAETSAAMHAAAAYDGPVFLRLSRMPVPDVHPAGYEFQLGRGALLRGGTHLTLIANGVMVCRALEAAALLEEEGISAAVLNMATVRPIDRTAIVEAAAMGPIITIEEHTVYGGLGGAVAEVVVESHPVRMRMLGFPGEFAPTGSPEFLFEHFGLTPDNIRRAALKLVEECAGVTYATDPRG